MKCPLILMFFLGIFIHNWRAFMSEVLCQDQTFTDCVSDWCQNSKCDINFLKSPGGHLPRPSFGILEINFVQLVKKLLNFQEKISKFFTKKIYFFQKWRNFCWKWKLVWRVEKPILWRIDHQNPTAIDEVIEFLKIIFNRS